jgi:hypothetical protein
METPEFEHSHHHRTGRPWLDVLLGVSAVSISFISLFLAIANGRAMERLVQSNSWPFIQIGTSDVEPDSTPHIRFFIVNKGVGPARIESLEVTYNGTPMNSPRGRKGECILLRRQSRGLECRGLRSNGPRSAKDWFSCLLLFSFR